MKANFLKRARYGAVLVASGALMSISCSRDTPYSPLKTKEAPRTEVVGGTVRDMVEKPVANALVTLEPAQNGVSATARWVMRHPGAMSGTVPGRRVTLTSESGRYAFDQVAGGEYILHVLAEDHLGAVRTVTVPSVAQVDTIIVDVNLTPTGSFAGKVFLEGASTYANTIVYVQGTSYVAVTDPSANYAIHGVPVGSYTVRATHPGYLDDTRDSTITTAGQVVALTDMSLRIDANIPPTATASAPSQNCELDPVTLSGAGSSDVDGSITLYAWDFEDDGSVDYTSASPTASHTYANGTHRAKLRVTDNRGAIGFAVVTFTTVKADTVFVAATGNDANPGTRSLPKQTIAAGITAAIADTMGLCPATVVVAGDHMESPVFLPDMRVRGGYDATTWSRSPNSYSVVNVQNTPALANNINGANASTVITGFDFQGADGQGGTPTQRNSIAMRVVSSNALTFDDCRFLSGNGSAGPNGVSGTSGGSGGSGGNGSSGIVGSGGVAGTPGGFTGGQGGGPATAGSAGQGGCGAGGAAGVSQFCNGLPSIGGAGGGGAPCSGSGISGANGAAQPANGIAGVVWTPLDGFAGLDGTAGKGGGGGGGGGNWLPGGPNPACATFPGSRGGAGGGGGGGGGSATGGTGGLGGGASFAVYLYDSSPVLADCRFTSGNGGAGGAGGNGGSGGAGGAGGQGEVAEETNGAAGGAGGAGGHGGGGSGGPGGPSYCVYRAGSSNPVLTGSIYVTGSGGQGGAAGVRADNVAAAAGLNGPVGTIGP